MGNKESKKGKAESESHEPKMKAESEGYVEPSICVLDEGVHDQPIEKPKYSDFEAKIDKINERFEKLDEFIISKFASCVKISEDAQEKYFKHVNTASTAQKKRYVALESQTNLMIQKLKRISIVSIKKNSSQVGSVARKVVDLVNLMSLPIPKVSPIFKIQLRVLNSLSAFAADSYERITSQHFHQINRDVQSIKTSIKEFGTNGSGQNCFREPFGLAIHPHTGNYFIMNKDNQRVDEFTPESKFVRSYGNQSVETTLSYARGLAFNPAGTVLAVADTLNHKIQFWNMDGELIGKIERFGTSLRLQSAQFIAYDSDENLYVTDKSGRAIYKFNKEMEYVMSIGGAESEKPIGEIGGMMINDYGEIMAIACASKEVVVYTLDGQFIRNIPVEPTGTLENAYSNHLARGPNCFIVSDTSGFVRFYNYEGVLLNSLDMKIPVGTAFDLNSRLVVVDYRSCHVKIF